MEGGHKRTSELWADKGEEGKRYRESQKRFLELHQPNFITKENVLYYKDQPFAEIREGLLSGELDLADYPGFAIKFDTVTYHNVDPIANEQIILSGKNFELRNGVEYILDKSSGEYVLWDKYKNDFQTDKINNNVMHKIEEEFNNLGGLYLQTFISKGSPLNCGHALFDKLLVENDINWFTYIKFIKGTQTGDTLPAVVGKSGSFNVNSSGCDLSFSLNPEHGPSRKLVCDSNNVLDWLYNQVYVIPCDSEEQAYLIEENMADKYRLFYS